MNQNIEGNIRKYNLLKVFTKRVYYPLIAIFLTTIGGVTLVELGIIASVTAIVTLLLEIPSGYISDKWGHKSAMLFGSILTAISVLGYIFMPGFIGGLIASTLFFGGAAFSSGTMQAFMHETLLSLGRDKDYSRIMGRAQSYGLLGNVVLIALVPLTYQIHPLIPFIIGFLCLAISSLIIASFVQPTLRIEVSEKTKGLFSNLRSFLSLRAIATLFLVFVIFGMTSSAFDSASIYREILFTDFGIKPQYLGFILAIGNLCAAITGRYIHLLKRFSPKAFYIFDILYIVTAYVLVGITNNVIVIIFAFILFPTYDRTRNIIYESQLLEEFSGSKYKATIISCLNFFPWAFHIGIPLILAHLVTKEGILRGYTQFGGVLLVGLTLVFLLYILAKTKK